MGLSDFVAITKFLFHAQSLLRELQSLVEVFQFPLAIRDEPENDGFTVSVLVGLEHLQRLLELRERCLWTFLGIQLLRCREPFLSGWVCVLRPRRHRQQCDTTTANEFGDGAHWFRLAFDHEPHRR